ncbi:MAG: ARPP-1 family domain-containing protein, partial [Bryobacteraceae bacterium]
YAFAINGQLNSADLYASPALFRKMWPKLLKSSAVEAVANPAKGHAAPPSSDQIADALDEAERGRSTEKTVRRMKLIRKDSPKYLLFESASGGGWVHRSYLVK